MATKRTTKKDSSINPVIGAAGGAVIGGLFGPGGVLVGAIIGLGASLATSPNYR